MQIKIQKRNQNLETLKMLDSKFRFKTQWNNDIKLAFAVTGSYSFDELVRDEILTQHLIQKYKLIKQSGGGIGRRIEESKLGNICQI